jgi:hypothetical protein
MQVFQEEDGIAVKKPNCSCIIPPIRDMADLPPSDRSEVC